MATALRGAAAVVPGQVGQQPISPEACADASIAVLQLCGRRAHSGLALLVSG